MRTAMVVVMAITMGLGAGCSERKADQTKSDNQQSPAVSAAQPAAETTQVTPPTPPEVALRTNKETATPITAPPPPDLPSLSEMTTTGPVSVISMSRPHTRAGTDADGKVFEESSSTIENRTFQIGQAQLTELESFLGAGTRTVVGTDTYVQWPSVQFVFRSGFPVFNGPRPRSLTMVFSDKGVLRGATDK